MDEEELAAAIVAPPQAQAQREVSISSAEEEPPLQSHSSPGSVAGDPAANSAVTALPAVSAAAGPPSHAKGTRSYRRDLLDRLGAELQLLEDANARLTREADFLRATLMGRAKTNDSTHTIVDIDFQEAVPASDFEEALQQTEAALAGEPQAVVPKEPQHPQPQRQATIRSRASGSLATVSETITSYTEREREQRGLRSATLLTPVPNMVDEVIKLWPMWEKEQLLSNATPLYSSSKGASLLSLTHMTSVKYGDDFQAKGCWRKMISRPNSPRQMAWDVASIVCMFYDILTIPMEVFPIPESSTILTMDVVTAVFWTLDIANTFTVGYQAKGILEMRPLAIAKGYLRTFFCIDVVVVGVDWFTLITERHFQSGFELLGVVRISKWTRILRLLRLLRAIRIMKLIGALLRVADTIEVHFSERVVIFIGVLNAMLCILVACHFLACGWYWVGTLKIATPRLNQNASWTRNLAMDQGVPETSLSYDYLTALHWALTQFTPASMEVVPRNAPERIYTILTVLIALVVFSSFVSSITGSMARIRLMNIDHHRLVENTRRFIMDHKLTLGTGTRIANWVRSHSIQQKRQHELDEMFLQQLPDDLRQDLKKEIFFPVLMNHPLFWHHNEYFKDRSLRVICDVAMREHCVLEQPIFLCGQKARNCYFAWQGECFYAKGITHPHIPGAKQAKVGEGAVIAEATLWVRWKHLGTAFVEGQPFICMSLEARKYQSIVLHSVAVSHLRHYARQFSETLRLTPLEDRSDVSASTDRALEMAHAAFGEANDSQVVSRSRRLSKRPVLKLTTALTGWLTRQRS